MCKKLKSKKGRKNLAFPLLMKLMKAQKVSMIAKVFKLPLKLSLQSIVYSTRPIKTHTKQIQTSLRVFPGILAMELKFEALLPLLPSLAFLKKFLNLAKRGLLNEADCNCLHVLEIQARYSCPEEKGRGRPFNFNDDLIFKQVCS